MKLMFKANPPPKGEETESGDAVNEKATEPVDAPAGYAPRVVKTPMHDNADVNHETAQKMENAVKQKPEVVKKGAGWNNKDERMYNHIKDSGASERIAAATVNKQRKKEGRLLHKPNVKKATASEYGGTAPMSGGSPAPAGHLTTEAPARPMENVGPASAPAPAPTTAPTPPKPTGLGGESMNSMHKSMKPNVSLVFDYQTEIDVLGTDDEIAKAVKRGEGSRGGKIVRHTKSGKPVYESTAKRHAASADAAMTRWHGIAEGHGTAKHDFNPEHHAIAAKQALHAAYYHHHAGDEIAAHQAMDYANHHRAKYEKAGHTSRTTNAVAKLHHTTAHEIGHAGWEPKEHGLSDEHMVAGDADQEGKHKEAKKIRANSPEQNNGRMAWKKDPTHSEVNSVVGAHSGTYTARRLGDSDAGPHQVEHRSNEGKRTELGIHPGLDFAQNAAHNHNADMQHGRSHTPNSAAVDAAKRRNSANLADTLSGKSHPKAAKSMSPGNSIGGNMLKNEVADLFKSTLGESNTDKPITKCVHCKHDLTKSDLHKGLGPSFVADDNDNPHSGGDGQVEDSRAGGEAKENDVIAPLLKGMKGPEAGENEEFPIFKSEMDEMGMNTEGFDDNAVYTITKAEMKRIGATEHIGYLADRKTRIAKSAKPDVIAKANAGNRPGFTPRAGGVHNSDGSPLVEWYAGSDKDVANYIEKSGGYGPGTDESIRTQGRGEH